MIGEAELLTARAALSDTRSAGDRTEALAEFFDVSMDALSAEAIAYSLAPGIEGYTAQKREAAAFIVGFIFALQVLVLHPPETT